MDNSQLSDIRVWLNADSTGYSFELMCIELHHQVGNGEVGGDILYDLVNSDRPHLRDAAAWVLSELGPQAHPYVPLIIKLLSDSDPTVRWHAADAIAAMGPNIIRLYLSELLQLLNDPEPCVVQRVVRALLQLDLSSITYPPRRGGENGNTGRTPIGVLCDASLWLTSSSASLIGNLENIVADDHQEIRLAGLCAAFMIGEPAVSVVHQAIKYSDLLTRFIASEFAFRAGPSVSGALFAAVERGDDPLVISGALHSLAEVNGYERGAERLVVFAQLRSPSVAVRIGALIAIRRLSSVTPEELESIRQLNGDVSEDVRLTASRVLDQFGGTD